jgi:hypothetical protein
MNKGTGNEWIGAITIPHIPGNMSYRFLVEDSSGNEFVSEVIEIGILDNDMPVLLSDDSQDNGTTGDAFVFSFIISDNIEVSSVKLSYGFGEVGTFAKDLFFIGDQLFELEINLPSDFIGDMSYHLIMNDSTGNVNITEASKVEIFDNDLPFLAAIDMPMTIGCGEILTISLDPEDNIEVDNIEGTYSFGTGERMELFLERDGELYVSSIEVPSDSLEPVNIFIDIFDVNGNENISLEPTITLEVLDVIDPVVQNIDNSTIYQGEIADIAIMSSDNIGVTETILDGAPEEMSEDINGVIDTPGKYDILITVKDAAGNSDSVSFVLEVLSEDNDIDGDGLTDLDEFEMGTDHLVADSDSDGTPDGWEVFYGLDPLVNDSYLDTDGDGRINLDEYLKDKDPNVDDVEEEDGALPIVLIVVIIIVLLALIGGVVFITSRKKRSDQENKEGKMQKEE